MVDIRRGSGRQPALKPVLLFPFWCRAHNKVIAPLSVALHNVVFAIRPSQFPALVADQVEKASGAIHPVRVG